MCVSVYVCVCVSVCLCESNVLFGLMFTVLCFREFTLVNPTAQDNKAISHITLCPTMYSPWCYLGKMWTRAMQWLSLLSYSLTTCEYTTQQRANHYQQTWRQPQNNVPQRSQWQTEPHSASIETPLSSSVWFLRYVSERQTDRHADHNTLSAPLPWARYWCRWSP